MPTSAWQPFPRAGRAGGATRWRPGGPRKAARVLREALGVWRGPPLADFSYEPFAQAAIAQLVELHLAAGVV
jgi:hypothetical protein